MRTGPSSGGGGGRVDARGPVAPDYLYTDAMRLRVGVLGLAVLLLTLGGACGSDDAVSNEATAAATASGAGSTVGEQGEDERPELPPEPPVPPEPLVAEVEAEDEIGLCGIAGTTGDERSRCESDGDCTLAAFDHRHCHPTRRGSSDLAYNCDFAGRLARECDPAACDDGSRGTGLRGHGGGPSYEAFCAEGRCQGRVATPHARSRLLRVDGPRVAQELRRPIRRGGQRIESCLPVPGQSLADDNAEPNGAGEEGAGDPWRFTVAFDIAPDGTVGEMELMGESREHGEDPSVVGCVGAGVAALSFPATPGTAPSRVLYMFAPRVERTDCGGLGR